MKDKEIPKESFLAVMSMIPLAAGFVRAFDKGDQAATNDAIIAKLAEIEKELLRTNARIPLEVRSALAQAKDLANALDVRRFQTCLPVLREISNNSPLGMHGEPMLSYEELCELIKPVVASDANIEREVKAVVHELENQRFVHKRADANARYGWRSIYPDEFFFARTDGVFQDWRPISDARTTCKRFPDTDETIATSQIREALDWPPRRSNAAIAFLRMRGIVADDRALGGPTDDILRWVRFTEEAIFFLDEE